MLWRVLVKPMLSGLLFQQHGIECFQRSERHIIVECLLAKHADLELFIGCTHERSQEWWSWGACKEMSNQGTLKMLVMVIVQYHRKNLFLYFMTTTIIEWKTLISWFVDLPLIDLHRFLFHLHHDLYEVFFFQENCYCWITIPSVSCHSW